MKRYVLAMLWLGCAVGCGTPPSIPTANQVAIENKLPDAAAEAALLGALLNPPSKASTGVNDLRSQMLTDAGRTVGFRGGMVFRAKVLAAQLERRGAELDKLYQFRTLVGKAGLLPPVIVQARDLTAISPEQMRTGRQVYRIEREERFVSVAPSWRDFLLAGLPVAGRVDLPVFETRPQDGREKEVWSAAVHAGWQTGVGQANAILETNFNRLNRDYTGMLLYTTLLNRGVITASHVGESSKKVGGNAREIIIDDRFRRLTVKAGFDLDERNWLPSIDAVPPNTAPATPAPSKQR